MELPHESSWNLQAGCTRPGSLGRKKSWWLCAWGSKTLGWRVCWNPQQPIWKWNLPFFPFSRGRDRIDDDEGWQKPLGCESESLNLVSASQKMSPMELSKILKILMIRGVAKIDFAGNDTCCLKDDLHLTLEFEVWSNLPWFQPGRDRAIAGVVLWRGWWPMTAKWILKWYSPNMSHLEEGYNRLPIILFPSCYILVGLLLNESRLKLGCICIQVGVKQGLTLWEQFLGIPLSNLTW